jgi:hypothetical protein
VAGVSEKSDVGDGWRARLDAVSINFVPIRVLKTLAGVR